MRKRPPRLKMGDSVGIIAPASPPNAMKLAKSIAFLENLGLNCVIGKSVGEKDYYLAGTDDVRLQDFNEMVTNPEIKAIFCSSGGYGSARIADKIDYILMEENPKIFWGFSDITFLHTAIGMFSDLVTFHGPTLSFLGNDATPERTKLMFNQLFNPAEILYDERISELTTIAGGKVRAPIVGGNLTLITQTLGTKFEIDVRDKVLLIEDVGQEPAMVDAMLNHLRMTRKFDHCAGIMIGSFTRTEAVEYKNSPSIEELFKRYFADFKKPVLSGFKMGHEALNVGIPLGVDVILDADEKYVAFLPGVE